MKERKRERERKGGREGGKEKKGKERRERKRERRKNPNYQIFIILKKYLGTNIFQSFKDWYE